MKKKRMYRLGGTMLAGMLLILAVLGGCGETSAQNPAKTSGGNTQKATHTLTLMCINTVDQDVLNDAIEEFNRTNTSHAKVEVTYYPNEKYKKEILRKMIAGEETDMFFSWTSGSLKEFVQMGKVIPLNYYLNQDETLWEKNYDPDMFDAVTFNGGVYAIPTTKCMSVVYYNKKVFEKYHLTPPHTYKEFLKTCETLKKNGITPLYMGSTPWNAGLLYLELLRGIGGNAWQSYDSAKEVPWTSKSFVLAAKEMQKLYKKGYIPKDFLNAYGEGKSLSDAAMYLNGNWFSGSGWSQTSGIFRFPAVDPAYDQVQVGGADRSFAISADCKHPQEAYEFLKLYAGEKYQERTFYEESSIPMRKLDHIEKAKEENVSEETSEVEKMMKQNPPNCIFMDVKYGSDFGTEFNATAQKILAGEDPKKCLEELQQYAQEE